MSSTAAKSSRSTALVRASQTALTLDGQAAFEEWKSSFWRRHPHRLIDKAIKQDRQDYLDILIGQGHGPYTLHWAAWDNNLKAIKMLLAAGVAVDSHDANSNTPLICAAMKGHTEAAELLLEAGADVNAQGECDRTALIWCGTYGYPGLCAKLLHYNPDPTLLGGQSATRTALQWAIGNNHPKTANIIASYEQQWKTKPSSETSPAVAPAAQEQETYDLPPGWSVVATNDVQMVIRTVHDETSNTTIKNIFDFNAGRLLTSLQNNNQPCPLQEEELESIKPDFLAQARVILDQALQQRQQTQKAQSPNTSMT